MVIAGKLIDTDALLKVIWVSVLAGVGGTAAFSLAIVGATRFSELRRSGHGGAAALYAGLGLVGLAICVGAIALGLVAIIKK